MSALPQSAWVPEDSFGVRLLRLRRAMRLSQDQIGRLVGVHPATWNAWEHGTNAPRNMAEIVNTIHSKTGVDRAWLMWGDAPGAFDATRAYVTVLPRLADRRVALQARAA